MPPIHLLNVFLAALAAFILGFLFHGPLTGKLWMKLANIHPTGNEKLEEMIPQMVSNLLVQLGTAFVFAVIYGFVLSSPYINGKGFWSGIILGIWIWLGFLVTSTSIEVIWMGKNYKLWLFEAACSLVVMMVMGAIMAA